MTKSFSDLGLPDACGPIALAYHEPSRTLVVHVGPVKDKPVGKRLFFRWTTEAKYQPVWDCPANTAIESFALDPSRPLLYFMTFTWTKWDDGSWAGDWVALYRFDLAEHRCDKLTQRGVLLPTTGYESVWLCEALSVCAEGRSLFCKVGMMTPPLEDGSSRADYWIAKLDVTSMKLEPVTKLEALRA